MAVDLKNVMTDYERILKELARSELTLKALKKLKEEQADFRSSRDWGYQEGYEYESALYVAKQNAEYYENRLADLESFYKVNRKQLDKVCRYYDDDDNDVKQAHEERISFLVDALGNDDAEQQLKDILDKKEIVPTVTYSAESNRLEESMSDKDRINQSCVLATQDLTTEIRVVYEDNPDEPVVRSSLLYWLYDNDSNNADAIESDGKELFDLMQVMLPIGVGITDSNGNLMQSVSIPEELGFYQINDETNQLMVKPKLSNWSTLSNFTHTRLKASSFKDYVEDANASMENTSAFYDVVKNYNGDFSGSFEEARFLTLLQNRKPQKRNTDITISQQIMSNIIAKGFDEEDHKKLEDEMQLAGWKDYNQRDIARKLSIHSFFTNRKYGFLLYPVDRGNFTSLDVTTLTKSLEFSHIEGGEAPEIKKGAAWAKDKLPEPQLNGNELRSTIALYCTLPEWDRRICRVLHRLERAHIHFNKAVYKHTENLFRLKRMQQLAELHRQYHHDSLNDEEKATNDGLISDLEKMYDCISDWIENPEDNDAIGLKELKDGVESAATELWDLLNRPAFSQELARYMATVGSDAAANDSESKNDLPPGPYMVVEPFWTHIFETLAKCYAAFKNTSKEELVWDGHVQALVLWVANSEDRGLDVDEEGAAELRNVGVDDLQLTTVLEPLSKRLLESDDREDTINDDIEEGGQGIANNPLYTMMACYTKIASVFHRVPGPPSVVQVALDVYSDYVSKLIGRSIVGKKSLHIKLFFGISKLYGLTKADAEFSRAKSDIYQLLKRHGRQYRPGGKKPNGGRNAISHSAKNISDRHILRHFPDISADGKAKVDLDNGQSFSEQAYTARRYLAYKSVMQVFHWALYFETWGNQDKENAADEEISLKYIRDVLDDAETIGGNYVKVISAKLLINQMLAGSRLADRALAKGFIQAGKNLAEHADRVALRIGVIASTKAALDAASHLDKGFYGQSSVEMSRSVGMAMVSYGYAARQFPEGAVVKMVQKTASTVAQLAVKRFAWLGAVIWIPVYGEVALVVGSILSAGVFICDMVNMAAEMSRTQLHNYFNGYWEELNKSTFGKKGEEKYCLEYYKSEIPNSAGFTSVFESADDRVNIYFWEDDSMDWQQFTWRAIIPLHLMGYDNDVIENLVKIEGKTIDEELNFINEEPKLKALRTETLDARVVKEKYKNFGVGSLIRFYQEVSSKENSELVFENGNTYKYVADNLESGVYTPDRNQPELLPRFHELLDDDVRIQALAESVGWYSEDYYKPANN